jgi:hypothetical protein
MGYLSSVEQEDFFNSRWTPFREMAGTMQEIAWLPVPLKNENIRMIIFIYL